jgi:hypothetical protein
LAVGLALMILVRLRNSFPHTAHGVVAAFPNLHVGGNLCLGDYMPFPYPVHFAIEEISFRLVVLLSSDCMISLRCWLCDLP